MIFDEYDLPSHLPFYYDKDGFLLGNSFLPKLRCTKKELNQFLDMDLDREIRSRAWGDFRCEPYEIIKPEMDDKPCSKDVLRMLNGARALIAHLAASGVLLPKTRWDLSELGGIHRPWGHWYSALDSEPFYQEGVGSLALICCKVHGYRIDLKLDSLQKWEMIFNDKAQEALRQQEKLKHDFQSAF